MQGYLSVRGSNVKGAIVLHLNLIRFYHIKADLDMYHMARLGRKLAPITK